LTTQPIPRRTFLKGVGTMMALPMLEAMLPLKGMAAGMGQQSPVRMAFMFVPNGVNMQNWKPATEGKGFELPYILDPLKNVREYVNVLTGLTQDKARPNGDGAG
jgi:Protein of unknown function (DUF1552).